MTSTPIGSQQQAVGRKMVPDDFIFGRGIGTGAFSRVVVAEYALDGQNYAIKIIEKSKISNAANADEQKYLLQIVFREMNLLRMCQHPLILRFYASMQTNENLLFVTEYCPGGELLELIKRRGSIPLLAARHLIAELVTAISYLHDAPKLKTGKNPDGTVTREYVKCRILHRDVKPENIMLTKDRHIKLIDFGTAIIVDEGSRDNTANGTMNAGRAGTFCGTTQYMSPELLKDNYTCPASDYWAVGCILYHCLTGRRLFEAATQYLLINSILEDEVTIPADIHPLAADLIQKFLVKDPKGRLGATEMGGFDKVKQHPFFSSEGQASEFPPVDWEHLHLVDVAPLWARDLVWVEDRDAPRCRACNRDFGLFRRRHHCRACGHVFCHDCSSNNSIIPDSSRFQGAQRVCDSCFKKIREELAARGEE